LGWENNSSVEKLKLNMVYNNGGAFLGIIKNDALVSMAGYYPFYEFDSNAWRIFYRTAALPNSGTNKGLHRGTGPRGRMYIDNFIKYCNSDQLYLTTNIDNESFSSITRYNRSLELESQLPDAYIKKISEMTLYNHKQAIWKLDVEKYLERTKK
jgi:hypothetical protein